nr:hypothetical protein CTI12_AA318980 [Tanacetum cinerariifolium]
MEYVPSSISKLENGNKRISFSAEEVFKGGQACSLQLYGYFVGTFMDYRVVRGNLMKLWRVYDIEEITKTNASIFYFQFKSEEGMKKVLESGPWMIQNVPLVLNIWEPGIWLAKTKPSSILIWVCVPRTDDEIAANTVKEAINVNSSGVTDSSAYLNEGFVTVRKKNKPVITQARAAPVRSDNYNNGNMYSMRGKGKNNGIRQFVGNQKQYGNSQGFNGTGNFWGNFQGNNASNRQLNNKNVEIKISRGNSRQSNGVEWQKNPKSNAGTGFVH